MIKTTNFYRTTRHTKRMVFFGPAVVGVVVCLSIYCYVHFSKCYRYWQKRNVSFEKPKLLFGNLLDIVLGDVNLAKYLAKLYRKFKTPYFGIFILNTPVLVVKDPNVLKHIFVKDFQFFTDKNFFTDVNIDTLFSKSIITASFKKWKFLRSQLTRIFTSGKIKVMMEMEKEIAEKLVDYLKTRVDKDFTANNVIGNFTTDAIAACFFGIDSNCFKEENPIKFHSLHLFPKSGLDTVKIYSYNFIHKAVRLFRFNFFNSVSAKFLNELFTNVIRKRKLENCKRYDLIDLLLNLKDADNSETDEELLVSQAISLLVAGQDTTNVVTSFTLHELCKNVEIQARLRTEINEVFQQYNSYESINKMKYLDMVVSETLRKYPVVNFLQRKCVEDYVVPETGLKIERDTNILIPIHGLHFDPEYYPDPEKFDPERFNDSNKHKINSSCVYLPFGAGPRNCIGKRFALLTVKVVLVYMLKHFKFEAIAEDTNGLVFNTSHIVHSANEFRMVCRLAN